MLGSIWQTVVTYLGKRRSINHHMRRYLITQQYTLKCFPFGLKNLYMLPVNKTTIIGPLLRKGPCLYHVGGALDWLLTSIGNVSLMQVNLKNTGFPMLKGFKQTAVISKNYGIITALDSNPLDLHVFRPSNFIQTLIKPPWWHAKLTGMAGVRRTGQYQYKDSLQPQKDHGNEPHALDALRYLPTKIWAFSAIHRVHPTIFR